MISAVALGEFAADKTQFMTLASYTDFARRYADFRAGGGLQAEIVARGTPQYRFFQYTSEASYQFTRPVNVDLLYSADTIDGAAALFDEAMDRALAQEEPTPEVRTVHVRSGPDEMRVDSAYAAGAVNLGDLHTG